MYYSWGWLKITGILFLNEQMTRISDNWTKSKISTFSGETAGSIYNIYDIQYCTTNKKLIRIEVLLSIIRSKLNCCQENKWIYCCGSTSATMSIKSIQTPFVPIKPRADLNHHQVGTWTLKCTRWNQTNEKLILTRFDILDLVLIDHFANVCSLLIFLI